MKEKCKKNKSSNVKIRKIKTIKKVLAIALAGASLISNNVCDFKTVNVSALSEEEFAINEIFQAVKATLLNGCVNFFKKHKKHYTDIFINDIFQKVQSPQKNNEGEFFEINYDNFNSFLEVFMREYLNLDTTSEEGLKKFIDKLIEEEILKKYSKLNAEKLKEIIETNGIRVILSDIFYKETTRMLKNNLIEDFSYSVSHNMSTDSFKEFLNSFLEGKKGIHRFMPKNKYSFVESFHNSTFENFEIIETEKSKNELTKKLNKEVKECNEELNGKLFDLNQDIGFLLSLKKDIPLIKDEKIDLGYIKGLHSKLNDLNNFYNGFFVIIENLESKLSDDIKTIPETSNTEFKKYMKNCFLDIKNLIKSKNNLKELVNEVKNKLNKQKPKCQFKPGHFQQYFPQQQDYYFQHNYQQPQKYNFNIFKNNFEIWKNQAKTENAINLNLDKNCELEEKHTMLKEAGNTCYIISAIHYIFRGMNQEKINNIIRKCQHPSSNSVLKALANLLTKMIQGGDNGIVKIDILSNALKKEQIFKDYLDLENNWQLSPYDNFLNHFLEFFSENGINLKETFDEINVLRCEENSNFKPKKQEYDTLSCETKNFLHAPSSLNEYPFSGEVYNFPLGSLPDSFSIHPIFKVSEKIMKKVEFPFFDDFGEVKGSRQYALTKLVLLGTENV
ncbi:MAG: hypothetical protein LBT82_03745, partial [Oscillospiraceae bacterium]|nr:hypothetical protein [Oscillospiraceae bacterium]